RTPLGPWAWDQMRRGLAETTSRAEASRGLECERAARLLLPVVSQIWDAAPLQGKLRTHPMTRKWSTLQAKPAADEMDGSGRVQAGYPDVVGRTVEKASGELREAVADGPVLFRG